MQRYKALISMGKRRAVAGTARLRKFRRPAAKRTRKRLGINEFFP
jgi:hypothetical protein